MTGLYVRSNISSITAQNQLNRSFGDLSNILTRLSTGLRINSGKDDPAGLIASELIKADMTATTKAISNTQRANSMVAIADSALGQINNLLNDIKGLVNEAASTGTMTVEQLEANQLQVNAALDSIDRIAKTTNYLGKNILDGALDFHTRGLDRAAVQNLNIYQANFGTASEVQVGINVIEDAARAQLFYDKAGISQDTVIEVAGNDGSNLINLAANSTVEEIAAAINLSSDSTGVRAIVGRDATAGQIFLTSAGLDNDINLTALMAGAAAGNYTIKFTAGNTSETTYTITEPQNGRPGIIDFQLKMQENVAPYVTKLDESYNGLFTYDIAGQFPQDTHIVVQTTNGQQIRHIEYVQSAGPNPSIPGGVAAVFDRVTGKLQIQYDASGNLTEAALAKAINAIDGFEYMGMFIPDNDNELRRIPGIAMAEIEDTGMFLHHTHASADGLQIVFEEAVGIAIPTAAYDAGANTLTITFDDGGGTTYQQLLDLLNREPGASAWTGDPSSIPAGSFQLVDQWGEAATGLGGTIPATVDETTTHLGNMDGSVRPGRTSIDGNIHLQTTHVDWNGLSLEIDVAAPSHVATEGAGTAKLQFSYGDALLLDGITFAFVNDPSADPHTFNATTGVLTINLDGSADDDDAEDAIITAIAANWTDIQAFTGVTGTAPAALDDNTGLLTNAQDDAASGARTKMTVPTGIQSVEFDRSNGQITVTGMPDTTYDDILEALKRTSTWEITTPGTNFTVPPNGLGLSWTNATGGTVPGTNQPATSVGLIDLNPVVTTPASAALQEWLAAHGSGTKSAFDMRANNAINITAAIPGTKFENTDVVYLKAQGSIFTETVRLGHQTVYLTTDNDDIADYGNYSIEFRSTNAATTTAAFDGNILRVSIAANATADDVLQAINNPLHTGPGVTPPPDNWGGFSFVNPNHSPVNPNQSAASLIGATLHLGNVQLSYSDTPSPAAATITLDNGAVQMRFVADTIGTQYNDVTIIFEHDTQNFRPGDVSAVYDEARKILHIRGQLEGAGAANYGALKAAVEAASPFRVDVTHTSDNRAYPLSTKLHDGLSTAGTGTTGLSEGTHGAFIKTGQYAGDVGGNNQTLYIMVAEDAIADDVVSAFHNARGTSAQIAANFIVSNSIDNNGHGRIFDSLFDADVHVRVFAGALTGGNSGLLTDVTAKELIDFINNDAVLSKLFIAELARGQFGNGLLTLFDEAAYYGSTIDDNALQFLGPKDSPDILFVIDGPNSQLGMSFVDNFGGGFIADSRPIASLNAVNPNAAFTVQALLGGSQYDDMVVRMIRMNNNFTAEDSYAVYKDGPSNAMAFVSIHNDPTIDGTTEEQGKFILYANQGGDKFNNVEIVARLDVNQSSEATAYFDELTKKLIITVNSENVQLTEALAAINNEGTFKAEFDYSFNGTPADESNGAGIATFKNLLSASGTLEAVIGNTGNTGGRTGGVLEVYVAGDPPTANDVIRTINNSPTVGGLFNAAAVGGTGAGTGTIHFRHDNIRQVMVDGKPQNMVNMVTGILGSDESAKGYMIIHLATDANGNSITTANDLVKFFDQLTPEQTRGISVSVVRPPGVDNLDRKWTVDVCGTIIEEQICDNLYGHGLLQPTYMIDDCYDIFYFPIEFFSFGQDIRASNAYGSVIAQNGINASLDIRSKTQGPDFNGVGFRYVKLSDPLAQMYAEYDEYSKMITVFVHEGATASQVKQAIDSSEQTMRLFEVTLPGNGSGIISLQDDYMLMRGGLNDLGYRGGAAMLGAADADAHRLILESLEEGSSQYVSVRWLAGGDFRVTDAKGNTTDTAHGVDMIATINGMRARAEGRSLSLDSAMLKMGVILDERVTTGDRINFTITGGGAVIQMGTDVVSNQQIRFGIQSVTTAHLGGASGRLYQLREGGSADLLTSDASRRLADRIVNEAILYVSQTRGRLGAMQRYTFEPQISALQDSMVAMSAAEAQISNADFAEESSLLTRAQILVQAGTRTLSIANQFPQYAASLLGG